MPTEEWDNQKTHDQIHNHIFFYMISLLLPLLRSIGVFLESYVLLHVLSKGPVAPVNERRAVENDDGENDNNC